VSSASAVVLVVDDAASVRAWVRAVLEADGLAVLEAEDVTGAEALTDRADLVVLDWRLPGGSGLELCRRLAESDGPPVVMLTGLDDPRDRNLARQAGAAAYVHKDGNVDPLRRAVRDCLDRGSPR
jgi:two-component system, OmpR family, response regulator